MPYLNDPVSEIMDVYAYRARRQRLQAQAASITPDTARMLSSYARNTPWIKPGVAIGLSRFGIGPNDPRVEAISKSSLFNDPRFQYANGQYGEQVRAGVLAPGVAAAFSAAKGLGHSMIASAPTTRETAGRLREEGWKSLDQILDEHPELRTAVDSASAVVKDGFITDPGNTNASKKRAYERLRDAFLRSGVDMPFVNKDDRMGIVRSSEYNPDTPLAIPVKYMDEELMPNDPSGGQGQFAGPTGQRSLETPFGDVRTTRRADPAMQQQLAAAGLNFDPANPVGWTAPMIQPTLAMLDAPAQEMQGQFRNIIAATNGRPVDWTESQSDFGIMMGSMRNGRSIDGGNGFFVNPESEVARIRRDREMKRGQIGTHSITIGRWLADTVTEPDTTPFNVLSGTVDAGVQLADPTSYALGKIGNIRKARSLFEAADAAHDAAGLIPALRRGIHGPTAAGWLNSGDGIKAMEALRDETSAARIWVAMGRRTNPQLAARLADTSTTDEVKDILEEFLGPHIRSPAELQQAGTELRRGTGPFHEKATLNPRQSRSRLWNWMPGPHLDTDDPRQFATHLERHMINSKVPDSVIEEVLNDVARAESSSGLFQAAKKAMDHEQGILVAHGISKEHARTLTTLFSDNYNATLDDLAEEIGDDSPTWTEMWVDGAPAEIPGPHLVTEHVGRYIPLPEPRRIRRLTGNPAFRFLSTTKSPTAFGQNRFPVAMLDFMTQEIWKTTTLLGRFPAWIARVVGESQLRMAASGRDSLFRHPIDFFGVAIGRKGGIGPDGVKVEEMDEFIDSLTKGNGNWITRPGAVRSSRPIVIPKQEEFITQFRDAWADELARLSHDPVARQVMEKGVAETERWLMVGDQGKRALRTLREGHPGSLMDSASIQEYLQSVARRVTLHTGGNTELLDAVRTGRLSGVSLSDGTRTNRQFIKKLEGYLDSAPDKIRGDELDFRRAGMSFPERWNRVVDWMFAHTMGAADNFWDRAPVFKQNLWRHTMELLPFADPMTQVTALRNARKANLPSRMMKGLEKAARTNTKDGLSIEELSMLARGYAADSSKKLLYDLAEQGQLADAARIIAPFGNAYQEIFGAWNNILTELGGPGIAGKLIGAGRVLRRAQQLIEGARGEDFGETVGAPSGEGFFFKDEFGEEVFVIPGSQWLTSSVTGVPTPMTGSVQGLNMIGNVVPGLGPAAAIPVAWMIQDKPVFNDLHEMLLPYGAPGERQRGDIFQALNYAPPWTRRAFDFVSGGGYDQRLWANTQKDVMAYLYSTGEYDMTTRAGIQELTHDAKNAARKLYGIRAGAQFFSPTTPSFRFLIEDKSGQLLASAVLVEKYYELQQADYETASQTFMELFGEDAILAVIPKSGATTYGIPRNQKQLDFTLEHPSVKNDFPSTYGFFLPQDDEFDYEVYLRSFIEGEREDLSANQWVNLSNSMIGDMVYRRYQDMVGDRTDAPAREWLRGIRRQVMELFPSGPTGLPEKPDTEEMVAEFYRAVESEEVLNTDAGQGLAIYLQYRDQAQAAAEALGRASFNSSEDTLYIRQWLDQVAAAVIEEHPDFQFAWDIVLSREAKLED